MLNLAPSMDSTSTPSLKSRWLSSFHVALFRAQPRLALNQEAFTPQFLTRVEATNVPGSLTPRRYFRVTICPTKFVLHAICLHKRKHEITAKIDSLQDGKRISLYSRRHLTYSTGKSNLSYEWKVCDEGNLYSSLHKPNSKFQA